MKLIYLEWEDAIANSNWFGKSNAEEWGRTHGALVKECGWLVMENKEFIVLASRLDNDILDETQFGGLQKIPKTWVRKRKELRV